MKKTIAIFAHKLSPAEMKKVKGQGIIIPGNTGLGTSEICFSGPCWYYEANTGWVNGACQKNSAGRCVCNAGTSSIYACRID